MGELARTDMASVLRAGCQASGRWLINISGIDLGHRK